MKNTLLATVCALPFMLSCATAPDKVDGDKPEAVLNAYLQALMACRLDEAAEYLHVPKEILQEKPRGETGLPPPYRLFAFDSVLIHHGPFASEAAYKAKMREEVHCDFGDTFKFYPEKTVLAAPQIAPDGQTAEIAATVAFWDAIDNRDEDFSYGYTLAHTDEGWKVLPGTKNVPMQGKH